MEAQVQNAVEVASNPSSDQALKAQAFDFLNQVRADPASWVVGLSLFTKDQPRDAPLVPHVRFFCLELVNNAVTSRQLDHHNLVSAKINLMDYVKRAYGHAGGTDDPPQDPPYITNKLAQTLTFLFTSLYASGWESFFADLRAVGDGELDNASSNSGYPGLRFYLKMLASVHDEIADVLINTANEKSKHHTLLKDLVRQRDIGNIAQSWQDILSRWQTIHPSVTQLCLDCMSRWVSWSDISLFANENVVQYLLQIAGQQNTGHPDSAASRSRDAAIGVFTETVAKKMKPNDKISLIRFLNLDTVVGHLLASPPLQNRESPDYDTDMAETVAKLVNNVVLDVVEALNADNLEPQVTDAAAQLLNATTPQVLRFLADEYDEVCSTVIPALTEELILFRKIAKAQGGLPSPYSEMLLPILNALVSKMRIDDTANWGEDGDESDEAEFEELRKRLRVAQQNVATIDETLYLQTLGAYIESIFARYREQPGQVDWRDLEVALVEMSLVGELAVRNSGLYQKKMPSSDSAHRLVHLMGLMMDANVADSDQPAVHTQFMDLCVKYHSFFSQQQQYLPKCLEDFAKLIHNPEEKHRLRSWHLFFRFVQRLRSDLGKYSQTIIGALGDLLHVRAELPDGEDGDSSESGAHRLEDVTFTSQLSLFEAVGCLSSAPGVAAEAQVTFVRSTLEPLLSGIASSLPAAVQGDERLVLQVHHLIEAAGTLARGFSEWTPGKASTPVPDEVSSEFQTAADTILAALEKLKASATIREAARFAFSRLIGVLGFRILQQLPQWIDGILSGTSSRDEVAVFLRLLGQVVYGFKGQLQEVVDSLFRPLIERVFTGLGAPVNGTDDELQLAELRHEYLNFLLVMLQESNELDQVLVSTANQPVFETIVASIEHYAKDTSDTTDSKLALAVATKMCDTWGGPAVFQPAKSAATNGQATPSPKLPGFDHFMVTRFSALTWAVMTNASFRIKEPPANKAVGEIASLQLAILSKTGQVYVSHLRDTELPGLGLQAGMINDYIQALTTLDAKAFKQWLLRFLAQESGGGG